MLESFFWLTFEMLAAAADNFKRPPDVAMETERNGVRDEDVQGQGRWSLTESWNDFLIVIATNIAILIIVICLLIVVM